MRFCGLSKPAKRSRVKIVQPTFLDEVCCFRGMILTFLVPQGRDTISFELQSLKQKKKKNEHVDYNIDYHVMHW